MIIDAGKGESTFWSQPEEFKIDAADPLASLGEEPAGGYVVVLVDGAVLQLSGEKLVAMLKGEEVSEDFLRPRPQRVEVPPYGPADIAAAAMKLYDANSDGVIAGEELQSAASLVDGDPTTIGDHPETFIDKNADGKVTKNEIQARVQAWIDSKVGIMSFHCVVTLDGQPLEGAQVQFIPEKFMGQTIDEASGRTTADGVAVIAIDQAKLEDHLKGINGVRCGFYKVLITHPSMEIPAKYNTATTLGREVASDSAAVGNVVFKLESK
jgi:hypothetical protein